MLGWWRGNERPAVRIEWESWPWAENFTGQGYGRELITVAWSRATASLFSIKLCPQLSPASSESSSALTYPSLMLVPVRRNVALS